MKAKDARDRYPSYYYYGVFCMIDLAKGQGVIDKYEANDDAWDMGCQLYDAFFDSKHNTDNQSEIDCMEQYLKERLRKVIVWKDRTATYWDNGEIVTTELWELK